MKKGIYIVENLEKIKFNADDYFSMRVILLDGIRNAKQERKAKSEGLQEVMHVYRLVKVKS